MHFCERVAAITRDQGSPPPPNPTPRDTHVSRRTDPPEGEGRELHVRRGHHRQCWADRVEVGGHRGRLRAKEPQRDAGARAARQEIGQEEAVESSSRCRVVVWGGAFFRGGSTSIDSDLNRRSFFLPPTKCHEVVLEGGHFFFWSGYFLRHTLLSSNFCMYCARTADQSLDARPSCSWSCGLIKGLLWSVGVVFVFSLFGGGYLRSRAFFCCSSVSSHK